jgi:hypothetical protein
LLETYLKHNGIDGIRERQARDIWHVFKTIVDKPIAKCTRDDGRAIVADWDLAIIVLRYFRSCIAIAGSALTRSANADIVRTRPFLGSSLGA